MWRISVSLSLSVYGFGIQENNKETGRKNKKGGERERKWKKEWREMANQQRNKYSVESANASP